MRPHAKKSPAKSTHKSRPHLDRNAVTDDTTTFQTPERENVTDYGLEFTTRRLSELNTSPRRSHRRIVNTLSDRRDAENQPPKTPKPAASHGRSPPSKKNSTARRDQQPKSKSRRKQANPESRVIKMHREMERLQKDIGFMIPRLPFSRLVREIIMKYTITPFKITIGAMEAIQTATEMYLTQRFQDAYLLTQYRSRVTLEVRDMAMVAYFARTYGNL